MSMILARFLFYIRVDLYLPDDQTNFSKSSRNLIKMIIFSRNKRQRKNFCKVLKIALCSFNLGAPSRKIIWSRTSLIWGIQHLLNLLLILQHSKVISASAPNVGNNVLQVKINSMDAMTESLNTLSNSIFNSIFFRSSSIGVAVQKFPLSQQDIYMWIDRTSFSLTPFSKILL